MQRVGIKSCTCYYLVDIITSEVFDLDNTLLDEK